MAVRASIRSIQSVIAALVLVILASPLLLSQHVRVNGVSSFTTIKLGSGTLAAPSLSFASAPTTGLFLNGSDPALVRLGVARFEVESTVTRINAPDGGAYLQTDNGRVIVNSASLQFHTSGVPQITVARAALGVISIGDSDSTPEIRFNVSGSPTLSSCGDGALATGSSNTLGRVVGTTQTGCTITFSTSFLGNSADCFTQNVTSTASSIAAATSTALTVSGLTAGDDFTYMCMGR